MINKDGAAVPGVRLPIRFSRSPLAATAPSPRLPARKKIESGNGSTSRRLCVHCSPDLPALCGAPNRDEVTITSWTLGARLESDDITSMHSRSF